jgi:hypothetical protein
MASTLRASVSLSNAALGASVQIPVAAIDHIVLQVDAQVDVRGLHFQLADAFALVDTKTIAFGKALADAVALADAITTKGVGKSLADAVTMTDAFARTVQSQRTFADAVVMSDSGLLLNQSYVDPSYFAEDYVGTSRTF